MLSKIPLKHHETSIPSIPNPYYSNTLKLQVGGIPELQTNPHCDFGWQLTLFCFAVGSKQMIYIQPIYSTFRCVEATN
jgi:hypothetical protein